MADTLNDAFDELAEQEAASESSDSMLVINNDLRTITVPKNFIFGVYNDKNVLSIDFEMPRYYDDIDLATFSIQINYVTASGVGNIYEIENPTIGVDKITFEWLLDRGVFLSAGEVRFVVCLRQLGDEGAVIKEFNTTVARGTVLEGLEIDNPEDPEAYSILAHMKVIYSSTQTATQFVTDKANQVSSNSYIAEGYASGTRNGTPVGSDSPYYQNNAKWYMEQANQELLTSNETLTILNQT